MLHAPPVERDYVCPRTSPPATLSIPQFCAVFGLSSVNGSIDLSPDHNMSHLAWQEVSAFDPKRTSNDHAGPLAQSDFTGPRMSTPT
jgi:hypothetical protein